MFSAWTRSQDAAPTSADAFAANPDSPWLISFPHTGSHWLRMVLELYSDRPLLPRSFLEHFNRDYLLHHTHDQDYGVEARRVIYLYRDPTPTVFSQIKMHDRDLMDRDEVELWATLYRVHLKHWLSRRRADLTVVRYEDLRDDTATAIAPVLASLGLPMDHGRLQRVAAEASRLGPEEQLAHDPHTLSRQARYDHRRAIFADRWERLINELVIEDGCLDAWFARPQALRRAA